jgi:2'-5' RNA ligase
MISLKLLVEETYEYGCVMAEVPTEPARQIMEFSRATIPDSILYEEEDDDSYGREDQFHTTIKYGLTKQYDEEEIKEFLAETKSFSIEIKGMSVFENEKFDVVKFDIEGKELRRLNKIFSALPNEDEYDTYRPHMTLAYVTSGMGKKYVKKAPKMSKIMVNTIIYSDRGNKTYITL